MSNDRHHAARQRGALAGQRTESDQHPTLPSNVGDVRIHLLAAGFGYLPTLTSDVETRKTKDLPIEVDLCALFFHDGDRAILALELRS